MITFHLLLQLKMNVPCQSFYEVYNVEIAKLKSTHIKTLIIIIYYFV